MFFVQVILNVYDLSPINEWGYPVGLGVFHSGLEVDGREYTFAGGAGIFSHDSRKAPGARFREAIDMGSFSGEPGTLDRALDVLRDQFGPSGYNVLTRNCNHFSAALCEELLGRPIPGYVNRLAWMGSWFSCLVPKHLLTDAPVNEGRSGYSGYKMIAPPGRSAAAGRSSRPSDGYVAFAGSGMSLANNSGTSEGKSGASTGVREVELSDRRERMRAAAIRRADAAAVGSAGNSKSA